MENAQDSRTRFEGLFVEMLSESDRGCILTGASVLDDLLAGLLKKRLGRTEHVSKLAMGPLFASMGPLSSFSARIKLAYCLDLISQWEFDDLELIRRIRNKAAHEYTSRTFTDNEIIQLSQRLDGANRAGVAMQKYRPEPAEAKDDVGGTHQSREGVREISKERLRFQFTVVYVAGRLDFRAVGPRSGDRDAA